MNDYRVSIARDVLNSDGMPNVRRIDATILEGINPIACTTVRLGLRKEILFQRSGEVGKTIPIDAFPPFYLSMDVSDFTEWLLPLLPL